MEIFMEKFPQLFVAVYTGSLGETGNLRQFGFWLLNRGVFEDVPVDRPNEAGILLVIDPDSKSAGISFGYLLDAFLDEQDTFECLSRAHSYWLQGHYADGVLRCLSQLKKLLERRSTQARRDEERFERKVAMPVVVGDLVKQIRNTNLEKTKDDAGQEVKR